MVCASACMLFDVYRIHPVVIIIKFQMQIMERVLWQIGTKFIELSSCTETQHWNNRPISSTRLLELTKTIRDQGSNKQVLDKLKVERERGITVKAQVMIQWGFQMINGCSVIILTKMYLDCVNVLHVQRAEIPFEPDWYSGKISKCEILYRNALSWRLKRGLGACGL